MFVCVPASQTPGREFEKKEKREEEKKAETSIASPLPPPCPTQVIQLGGSVERENSQKIKKNRGKNQKTHSLGFFSVGFGRWM
jgi:hypothetical protein